LARSQNCDIRSAGLRVIAIGYGAFLLFSRYQRKPDSLRGGERARSKLKDL